MPSIIPENASLDVDTWSRLESATTEMKTDKFWRDMAKPVDRALRLLRDEAEAFDSVSRKSYREQAIASFEAAATELNKAAEQNLFTHEAQLVQAALAHLRGDNGAVEEAKLQAEAAEKDKFVAPVKPDVHASPAAAPPAKAEFDEAAARAEPFKWEQDDDGTVSVRFAVPPECVKGDVKVSFGSQHLTVAIAGHPLQPLVVDADLLYGIKSSECSWGLEGKGSKRVLALSLEKSQPHVEWASVIADDEGRKKKGLTELVSGIEGLEGLKTYGSE